jgi:hypothetical protein
MSVLERICHETVVKVCRALSLRFLGNCLAVRPGGVANRNRLRHPASLHHGRSAEAGGKAEAGGIPPDIVNRSHAIGNRSTVNRSNGIGSSRFSIREDCQAGESRQQLQWWL